jgi:beta-galactosidase
MRLKSIVVVAACVAALVGSQFGCSNGGAEPGGRCSPIDTAPRARLRLNEDWRFTRGDPPANTTSLAYADVKAWILPTGNGFVEDAAKRSQRPDGNLGGDVAYTAADYDDTSWQPVDLPHDYAVAGPFTQAVSVSMGQLPSPGVVWYRKRFALPDSDAGKSIFLDVDGAMSYSMVWLNGQLVGGWPYGYASFRLDLTPYVNLGGDNVLAIRLDNQIPKDSNWQSGSSRWYAGGGIYRNVWLVKTAPVHVGQWGTYITTPEISAESANLDVKAVVDNDSQRDASVSVATEIFEIDGDDRKLGCAVASIDPVELQVPAGSHATTAATAVIANPKLWGTGPNQKPNRYVAVTTVHRDGKPVDVYETPFGVRTLGFDPNAGLFVNGEHVKLNGVCNHHDLGALGAAINDRALQRQLEILAEMGSNAIRTSHNPPAPELLELADKMGFLIMDEAFDVWLRPKTELDYHLVYPEWHEQDLRALLRRDRNHPSVIMWSIGNEVGEQSADAEGAAISQELTGISHQEDPTRPTISGMNAAKATSPFPAMIDAVGLNYQGSGIRVNPPQYPVFHEAFPDKLIVGSETASIVSSRGVYTFPVPPGFGVAVSETAGEDVVNRQVSSYDLYYPSYASSPDKEFASQDHYPFVAGQFVWTGFDYLGEPTPFDSRSSYYGILDLAGFKKDLFYIYQSVWRPEYPMAHILPHWTWDERVGQVTPVHVYTSGDEAELFLNGQSLGRKAKAAFEYRLRWDDVVYEPGELRVVAYRHGEVWATESVRTAQSASKLVLTPDRPEIAGDGDDLSFVTLTVTDAGGQMVPRSMSPIHFEVTGPGEIVATDNGDPTDMTIFPSPDRKAFNGLALAIVRAKRGTSGDIVVTATSEGLAGASATIKAK